MQLRGPAAHGKQHDRAFLSPTLLQQRKAPQATGFPTLVTFWVVWVALSSQKPGYMERLDCRDPFLPIWAFFCFYCVLCNSFVWRPTSLNAQKVDSVAFARPMQISTWEGPTVWSTACVASRGGASGLLSDAFLGERARRRRVSHIWQALPDVLSLWEDRHSTHFQASTT